MQKKHKYFFCFFAS